MMKKKILPFGMLMTALCIGSIFAGCNIFSTPELKAKKLLNKFKFKMIACYVEHNKQAEQKLCQDQIMQNIILLVGFASGLTHSIYSVISKILLKNQINEPYLVFLYINIFQAVLTPAVWLFFKPALPTPGGWMIIVIAATTCVIAYLFMYMALSFGDTSSVTPIMGSKVILAGLIAIPLLNEKHDWSIYLAALIVALSIGLLSYSPNNEDGTQFPLKPVLLMIGCSVVFAFTDIFLKRSLDYINLYNFMVYYNYFVGVGSFLIIPHLIRKKVSLVVKGSGLWLSLVAAFFLVVATLMLLITMQISQGVLIPNILVATRGIFLVIISAGFAYFGSNLLERQTKGVYILRFVASVMVILSIWLTLR